MLEPFLFILFAIVAITAAIGMVTARSPVNSALWLVLNFFCIACLYLMLHAQFIGVIQILVYAGAIMVLFLFVIMLLNLDVLPSINRFNWQRVLAYGLGVLVLTQLVYVVAKSMGALPQPATAEVAAEGASAKAIGTALFTQYAFPVEVIGILLLAATIGAVLLAKKKFV